MDRRTTCPACGADVEPHQEYCLECGVRLNAPGLVPALATGWRRRVRWYPGDWIWPSLLALVVAILAGGAAILWTRDAESAASKTLVGDTAQLPTVSSVPPTVAETAPTVPARTNRTSSTATTTRSRPNERRHLIQWPRGRSGWMLVLASYPTSAGREKAVAKARHALAAGLPQVGVLDSGRYSSLHPGYFVVFSGIYPTLREAQDAASKAASSGYNAYPRRVTS